MPEHNIDPQEIEDREDLASLLTAPTAGAWEVIRWDPEYVVAEGEHDTARCYGGGYAPGDWPRLVPHPDDSRYNPPRLIPRAFSTFEEAEEFKQRIHRLAADMGATASPIVRMRRVATVVTPWGTP